MKSNSPLIEEEKKEITNTNNTVSLNSSLSVKEITSEELAGFFFLARRPKGIRGELNLNITSHIAARLLREYPIYIPENSTEGSGKSLYKILEGIINPEGTPPEPGSARAALYNNLAYWVQLYGEQSRKSYGSPWGPGDHKKLAEAFLNSFEASEETKKSLEQEFTAIISSLSGSSKILPFNENIHLQSGLDFLQTQKRLARETRLKNLKDLISKLKDLIEVHRSHLSGAVSADSASNPFGGLASINLDKLSSSLPKYKGAEIISKTRLKAMIKALDVLQNSVKKFIDSPLLVVFSSCNHKSIVSDPKYIQWETTPNPLEAASGFIRQLAQKEVETLRSIKLAQIETRGIYREDIHPAYLDSLKWDFNNKEDMALLPEMVIYERFQEPSSLVNLTAEYPLKILLDYNLDELIQQGKTGFKSHNVTFALRQMFGLKCFVSHTNSCSSTQLLDNLEQFSKCPGLAISMACIPDTSSKMDFEYYKIHLAQLARLAPYLRYNPSEIKGISQSLTIALNPCLGEGFGSLEEDGNGDSITPAHVLMLFEKYESEFLRLEHGATTEILLSLSEYLEKDSLSGSEYFPVINYNDGGKLESRLVLSKNIVSYCADVLSEWRELQELGGIHNYHAEKAKTEISAELEAKHLEEMAALKAAHSKELEEVKQTEGALALTKLAEGLLNLKLGEASGPVPAAGKIKSAQPDNPEPESPLPVEKEPNGRSSPQIQQEAKPTGQILEAYIDSELCTSCNDCINVNNRMFKYNGDKQAEIADVTQGTFAQLVKAALKCPAKCIHPGIPRAGDGTATPELISQAETLN